MPSFGSKYRKGYSIGVGGVVLCDDKALLARRALGSNVGDWMIPGGFVEPYETIDVAAQREVMEETGVEAEVEGLIAVRNQVSDDENSAYFIFLLRATDDEVQADGIEVAEARFFTLDEMQALPQLQPLSRLIVTKALRGEAAILEFNAHPRHSPDSWVSYV
jgi:8-oxo-dGTP diphosphatase